MVGIPFLDRWREERKPCTVLGSSALERGEEKRRDGVNPEVVERRDARSV